MMDENTVLALLNVRPRSGGAERCPHGNTVLALFNDFVGTLSKTSNISLVRFNYDDDLFGNYDVVFRFGKTEVTFNSDRRFLTVDVSTGKNQRHDYFKVLARTLHVRKYDCNSLADDKKLPEALKVVSETISELLNALKQKKHYVFVE
jgi:hypothetical protein